MDERRYKIVRQKAYKKIIYLDSQSAIQLVKTSVYHSKTKHIRI